MKYFRQLKADLATGPLLGELAAFRNRQHRVALKRDAHLREGMALRSVRTSCVGERARRDVHETRWTETSRSLRYTCNFLKTFAAERGVELGRAKVVLLPAGRRIQPHVDRGDYYLFRDRYHFVLKSASGSWLKAGDEDVIMREGELWWFNNKTTHEAANHGAEDCIHLIFDALNADGRRLLAHAERTRARREAASQPAL